MYILTGKQMKLLDQSAIQDYQLPALLLMEHAALALYRKVAQCYTLKDKILVVCGAGNNGGDGLALSRLLKLNDYDVTVTLLAEPAKLSELSRIHYAILRKMDVPFQSLDDVLSAAGDNWTLIVDAIFGVSLNRPVGGKYAETIDWINRANCPVLAVDIPSGVAATSGKCLGTAVKAEQTVSFAAPKIGLYLYPGAKFAGRVSIADIGIPKSAYQELKFKIEHSKKIMQLLTEDAKGRLQQRSANSNKGSYGKALIVAGSANMAGAALMAGKAAYKVGCGLVNVLTVQNNLTALNSYLPEAISSSYRSADMPEKIGATLSEQSTKSTALLIGPGLSTDAAAKTLLETALTIAKPLVIDADGLNLLAKHNTLLKRLKARAAATILTPHIGEMTRLIKVDKTKLLDNLIHYATQFARRHNVILALKSARTVIATPDGQTYLNITGNHGMATAGSGDVLAGMIVGLLANPSNSAIDATNAAVYEHAKAGDRAAQKVGESALMASDIIDSIYIERVTIQSK